MFVTRYTSYQSIQTITLIGFWKVNMQQELEIEDLVKGTSKGTKRFASLCNHFIDRLENGTKFDSSCKKNAPFQTFLSNKRIIQGWILGLKKLEMSDKRGLRLPTLLTYWDHKIGTTLHLTLILYLKLNY